MDNGLGTALAPIPATKKASARIALVDLQEPSRSLLAECFHQFGLETREITGDTAERMLREKFEACALQLTPGAEAVMEAIRTSRSNSRMVIYGLGGSAQDAMAFSKYGVNAVFTEPLERQAALKLVRATRLLVLHEFRRYVRIPVMTEVSIVVVKGRRFTATSLELSSGGMSLKGAEALEPGTSVEVSLALLTLPRIRLKGSVAWKRPKGLFGIKFDPADERRRRLKEWVDAYTEC
jgi:hypothetical protein